VKGMRNLLGEVAGREVAPYPYGTNILYMGRIAIHRYKYLI